VTPNIFKTVEHLSDNIKNLMQIRIISGFATKTTKLHPKKMLYFDYSFKISK